MMSRPVSRATTSFSSSIAGTALWLIGEMPISSHTVAMVLAVNWPPHAPGPGQAASSSAFNRASVIVPAACAPTASKTSWMVTSWSSQRPGAMEPP